MKKLVKAALTCYVLVLGLDAGLAAQDRTVKDGVFTEAQVASGKFVYDDTCKTCHDMRFFRDELKSWNKQPLSSFWEMVMSTMPADNPGSLGWDEYTNVIAYILSENGFPAGEHVLDPNNGMGKIVILAP